jgi:hypothetical protein
MAYTNARGQKKAKRMAERIQLTSVLSIDPVNANACSIGQTPPALNGAGLDEYLP